MYKYIESLIMEKNFSQAIDMLLMNYGKITAKERQDYDMAILALNYFKPYQRRFPKSPRDIFYIWKDFDQFLIEKEVYHPLPVVHFLGYSLMQDIFSTYSSANLDLDNFSSVHDVIMYATSMIWVGEIKSASSLLFNLLNKAPLEAEVWALCGKIYDMSGNRKKSELFYREAFFINPSVLNLLDVRHHLIVEIMDFYFDRLESLSSSKTKENLLEWIGISGVIGGFFTTRQLLTQEDEALLNRRIAVYEGYYLKGKNKKYEDFVKLLRLYLFKYDYYKSKLDMGKAQDTLKKLELLSPLVYNKL